MNYLKKFLLLETSVLLIIILSISCSTLKQSSSGKLKVSILAGSNHGGIVENTDMSIVPDVSTPDGTAADAFTGATRIGFNAGVHINHPLGKNDLETGLDYMFSRNTFRYSDIGNNYRGERHVALSQFMVPLTYNFVLIRKIELQLKLGFTAQFNFTGINDVTAYSLPGYKIRRLSAGPEFGISAFPVKLSDGSKIGLYFDVYRGTRIYEDFYNQASYDIPGSSFIKFGVKYRF